MKLFSKALLAMVSLMLLSFTTASHAQSGAPAKSKYLELSPAQPTEPGKIEVQEFFSYACSHCAVIEPMLQKWMKTVPADVVVKHVPVAFNASMKPLQRLYYTLEAMGRLDLHMKVFDAIHEQKKRLFSKAEITTWIVSQGVDRAKFEAAFESFGVSSKAGRADQLVTAYRVQGTPTMSVAGRFVTSPSEAGGYQETIDVANSLINQVRGK
jgi:thiol:disulfide interchange protein DsbA